MTVSRASAILAPDGFQYGVMYHDGSVSTRWNGRTQRVRVEEEVVYLRQRFTRDRFAVVRRLPGGPWEPVP